jgi:hypothetical protein
MVMKPLPAESPETSDGAFPALSPLGGPGLMRNLIGEPETNG